MDDTFTWVVVILVAAAVGAAVAWVVMTSLRSRQLRQRFGPEYERAVERAGGDQRKAEAELGDRVARRRDLAVRPLDPAARDRYRRRWEETQAEFVDDPGSAVQHAQALVDAVMAERGYAVGDELVDRMDLVSVDHPGMVEHYRIAHRIHADIGSAGDAAVATEERRQALVHYRALFADLLADESDGDRDRREPGDPVPDSPGPDSPGEGAAHGRA